MSSNQRNEGIGSSEEYKAYIELFLAIHKRRGQLKDITQSDDVDWLQCALHHIIAAEFDGFAVSEIFRYRESSGTYKDINYKVEGRFKGIKIGTPTFLTINMFTNKGINVKTKSTGEEFFDAFLKSGASFKGDSNGNFDKRYDLIIELLTVEKKDRYPDWFEQTIDKIEKNYLKSNVEKKDRYPDQFEQTTDKIEKNYLKSNYAAYNITIKETINEQIETNFNCLLKKQLEFDPEQFIRVLLWEKIKENITLSNIVLTELFDYFNNCIKININPIQITEKNFLNIIKNSIDYNNKNKDKNKERRLDIIPFDNKYNYLNIISFDNKNQQNLNNIQKDLYTIINLISEFIQSSINESQYTKKQIQEAISYWKKQLKIGNYFN